MNSHPFQGSVLHHRRLRNGVVIFVVLSLLVGCDDEGATLDDATEVDASGPFFDRADTSTSMGRQDFGVDARNTMDDVPLDMGLNHDAEPVAPVGAQTVDG